MIIICVCGLPVHKLTVNELHKVVKHHYNRHCYFINVDLCVFVQETNKIVAIKCIMKKNLSRLPDLLSKEISILKVDSL